MTLNNTRHLLYTLNAGQTIIICYFVEANGNFSAVITSFHKYWKLTEKSRKKRKNNTKKNISELVHRFDFQ